MNKAFTPPPTDESQAVRISVVVPVYNTERYLRQCIDSVLAQKNVAFELILVDDGSTDSSKEIIRQYAEKDRRVRDFYIRGRGPAEPRNYGTERANGEYVFYLDSDDYLPQDALGSLNAAASANPEAVFIKGNHLCFVNGQEKLTKFSTPRKPYANRLLDADTALRAIIGGHNIPCNILYRTSFLRSIGLTFEERMTYLEDGPYLMEFFSHNPKAIYVDTPTYVYRVGAEGSVTNTRMNLSKVESLIIGVKKYQYLKGKFGELGEYERQSQEDSYSWGALNGIGHLPGKERKNAMRLLHQTVQRIKPGSSPYSRVLTALYNVHPNLALAAINIAASIKH